MFSYFSAHHSEILSELWSHVKLAVIPVVIGLIIAIPLGWIAARYRWAYPPLISIAGLIYTIPSLVLFVAMPGILGTQILDVVNVVIALAAYAVALLVRVVADGLASVPFEAKQAATAMGYKPLGRFFAVELPLAVPVIAAGVRVATVSNVSLVTVATLIGTSQLGTLFSDGFSAGTDQSSPILLGIVLCIVLALVLDFAIQFATRALTPVAAGGAEIMIGAMWTYLTTGANWSGKDGLWANIVDQIEYSVIAVLIAVLIAFPLGLWIGHTGKGGTFVVGSVNATRALPTFGLMVLLFIVLSPHFHGRSNAVYIIPVEIVLVLLAIPPILSNTYAGVQSVDPAIRDAAKGMGMTGAQVLRSVELPNAFPLIMSGLRSASLQVIATATVGAYIGLGGLGRPIYDGFQQGPFQDTDPSRAATGQLIAGAVLVALLALLIDFILATIQRYATSRGITGRYRRSNVLAGSQPVMEPGAEQVVVGVAH